MKRTTLFCAMLAAAAFGGNAEAIFKCTTAKGVVYQDRPCREGAESDVRIVIPTGEVAPKSGATQEDEAQANAPRAGRYFGAPRPDRPSADAPATVTKPTEKNANTAPTPESRRKDAQPATDKPTVPMTAEQAQKTEATAKYFSTDAAAPGFEVPQQMTCESPTGEKRVFTLTGGKLTSI